MIYKQTICECLLQTRVCLKSSSQPGAVTKETLPLCSLLYADHRQRCFTLNFVCFFPAMFAFYLARKGEKGILLQSDFTASVVATLRHVFVSFCLNVDVNVHLESTDCRALSVPPISGRRLTQLQGYEDVCENSKPLAHGLWQSVVICAQQMVFHIEILV